MILVPLLQRRTNGGPHILQLHHPTEESDKLRTVITRLEQWPVNKIKLVIKHHKTFNL
jgi:hypothetical protein